MVISLKKLICLHLLVFSDRERSWCVALDKSLYDLKQASYYWLVKFSTIIKVARFIQQNKLPIVHMSEKANHLQLC